jgi:hypothetical protein
MNALSNIQYVSVDTLGGLLAEIAALTKQAELIKDALKDQASITDNKVFEGALFRATVSASNRQVIDYKTLVNDLAIDPATIEKYTKITAVYCVKTTSK